MTLRHMVLRGGKRNGVPPIQAKIPCMASDRAQLQAHQKTEFVWTKRQAALPALRGNR
jgi:hypothetical protein